jgi:hypothetical protein
MEQLKKNTSLSREYGQFISQFDWRYLMTCRHLYRLSEKTIRKWTDKLFKASLSISRIYWVMERDKADMSSKHVHMLLECSEEITQKQLKTVLNTSVGDFDVLRSKTAVSNYVTKFISSHNIEYDIVDAKS